MKRRDLLKAAAGLGLTGALGCGAAPRRSDLLRDENAQSLYFGKRFDADSIIESKGVFQTQFVDNSTRNAA